MKYIALAVFATLVGAPEAKPSIAVEGAGCVIVQFDKADRGTVREMIQVPKSGRLQLPNASEVYLYTLEDDGSILITGGNVAELVKSTAEAPLKLRGSCAILLSELDWEPKGGD